MKKQKINRSQKVEEIRTQHKKVLVTEELLRKQKIKLKEEKKKLKDNVKELINSYPSKKEGKKQVKKITKQSIHIDMSKVS